MSFPVEYSIRCPYRALAAHPAAPPLPVVHVALFGPGGVCEVPAIVDSGAALNLFDGSLAIAIGLDLLRGSPFIVTGFSGGHVSGYRHFIEMEVEGFRIHAPVVFHDGSQPLRRNFLGREGFFNFFQVGFREKYLELYLVPEA